MKQTVIRTVSFCLWLPFVAVALIAYGAISSGAVGYGIMIGIVGWVVASLMAGFWFALASISENSEKQVKLLEKLLEQREFIFNDK